MTAQHGHQMPDPFAPFRQTPAGMGLIWAEAMGAMGTEVLSFVTARIREDMRTQRALLQCQDMSEARQIQTRFISRAIDQYTAETDKLMEMGRELLVDPLGQGDT